MGIFAIIQLIISVLGMLPTIIKLVKEIFAMLKSKPASVQASVREQVREAILDCKTARGLGLNPNHELLTEKLQAILERLKN